MLPFSARYNSSPDFRSTVRAVLANPDVGKRIEIEILDGRLRMKDQSGNYAEDLLVNTFESEQDKETYSVNGYHVIVDSRPADTLAEIEAYCLSNDGKSTEISYQDYLTLSDVARLNFDFKLRYTGNELELTDELVAEYKAYIEGLGNENRSSAEKLASDLAENKLTKAEYNRAVYELYFTSYYPEITEYESSSKVPLLRNYYYHQYIKAGESKYLFLFDDYVAGSFETKNGTEISFYGFYSELENGVLVDGDDQAGADAAADRFIKKSFQAIAPLTAYAHAMNVFSLIPFIALMPMVVTLLAYSILKLGGIDSVTSLGGTFKIVGSYVWASAAIAGVLSLAASFLVRPDVLAVLPLLLLFITLAIRAVIYATGETKSYRKQSEEQETVQTEV